MSRNQALKLAFFACSPDEARNEALAAMPCDAWVLDWPAVDHAWLFGGNPFSASSPLARAYYDALLDQIESDTQDRVSTCEARRYPAATVPATGLQLRLSSRLSSGSTPRSSSAASSATRGPEARLNIAFHPGSGGGNDPPPSCPAVPRAIFAEPLRFGHQRFDVGQGNYRLERRNEPTSEPPPLFVHYDKHLYFADPGPEPLGSVALLIDRFIDLWVEFVVRPIPASVRERVNLAEPIDAALQPSSGDSFRIAVVLEIEHLGSGQLYVQSLVSPAGPAALSTQAALPVDWQSMSADAFGVIHHHAVDWEMPLPGLNPAAMSMPPSGEYEVRVLLLAISYAILPRQLYASAGPVSNLTAMSDRALSISIQPSLTGYTPGQTQALIPALTFRTERWVLATGIEFEAAFDLHQLTTFRFVVRLHNRFDFAVGVIVQAGPWQAWVVLQPDETRHLAGASLVSSLGAALHPDSTTYGWGRNWSFGSGLNVEMSANGRCRIGFEVYVTTPTPPQTVPANSPTLRATRRWYWNPFELSGGFALAWAAIERFAPDGRLDFEYALAPFQLSYTRLLRLDPTIGQPFTAGQLDATALFPTGYDTPAQSWNSPWHQSPWPNEAPLPHPLRATGQRLTTDAMHALSSVAAGATSFVVTVTPNNLPPFYQVGDTLRLIERGGGGVYLHLEYVTVTGFSEGQRLGVGGSTWRDDTYSFTPALTNSYAAGTAVVERVLGAQREDLTLQLTRAMVQAIAAQFGISERVIIDGADLRWFELAPDTYTNRWDDRLWVDRFESEAGVSIGPVELRAAFQGVLNAHPELWMTNYRSVIVHPNVVFGMFLGLGDIGTAAVNAVGLLSPVSDLSDLSSIDTHVLFHIYPQFQ